LAEGDGKTSLLVWRTMVYLTGRRMVFGLAAMALALGFGSSIPELESKRMIPSKRGGRLVIHFFSDEDLNGLYEKIVGMI
jgi:hypothetical protein